MAEDSNNYSVPEMDEPEYKKLEKKVADMLEVAKPTASAAAKEVILPVPSPKKSKAKTIIKVQHHDSDDSPANGLDEAIEKTNAALASGQPVVKDNADSSPAKSAKKTKAKAGKHPKAKKISVDEAKSDDQQPKVQHFVPVIDKETGNGEQETEEGKKVGSSKLEDSEGQEQTADEETENREQETTDEEVAEDKEPETEQETEDGEPEAAGDQEPKATEETKAPTDEEAKAETEVPPVSRPPAVAIDDAATDAAVEDILHADSDLLLHVGEDLAPPSEETEPAAAVKPKKVLTKRRSLKQLLVNKTALKIYLGTLLTSIIVLAVVPTTRYFALNIFGVRSSASMIIKDDTTNQPLKNVKVEIDNVQSLSGLDGKVTLKKLHLGDHQVKISRHAYADLSRKVTIGWGSNPLGDFKITATGSLYLLKVTDFLTGKPLAKIEASSGDASAVADDLGLIRLAVDDRDQTTVTVNTTAADYRSEQVVFKVADHKEAAALKLVPAKKDYFVSKKSGKYDLYGVDVDGKNQKLILAGTGNERDDITILPHPTKNIVAVVSTRANKHNSSGFLLSSLNIVDMDDNNSLNTVTQSEKILLIDWIGSRLIYVSVAAGASAANPNRQRLISYDVASGESKELAGSNYFNNVMTVNDKVYFAPSSAYSGGTSAQLYKVSADASGQEVILAQEAWNVFRTAYDHLSIAVQQDWWDYHVGDGKATKLASPPSNSQNRQYLNNPSGTQSLWIENRDGKGTLLAYSIADKKDLTVAGLSGLTYPVRWLNNHAFIFRVQSNGLVADYAMDLGGGEPVKVTDVTATNSQDSWYFY